MRCISYITRMLVTGRCCDMHLLQEVEAEMLISYQSRDSWWLKTGLPQACICHWHRPLVTRVREQGIPCLAQGLDLICILTGPRDARKPAGKCTISKRWWVTWATLVQVSPLVWVVWDEHMASKYVWRCLSKIPPRHLLQLLNRLPDYDIIITDSRFRDLIFSKKRRPC